MKKNDAIERMFIGALRTNTGPIRIQMGGATFDSLTIPSPDKQLGFEISLAVQSYYRRKKL
jgi:hypothetical protein